MSRTHSDQDVYLGDAIAYSGATVVEDPSRRTLKVRTRVAGKPGQWNRVIELTATSGPQRAKADTGTARTWTGTNADGDEVTLTAIPRKDCGCGRR